MAEPTAGVCTEFQSEMETAEQAKKSRSTEVQESKAVAAITPLHLAALLTAIPSAVRWGIKTPQRDPVHPQREGSCRESSHVGLRSAVLQVPVAQGAPFLPLAVLLSIPHPKGSSEPPPGTPSHHPGVARAFDSAFDLGVLGAL